MIKHVILITAALLLSASVALGENHEPTSDTHPVIARDTKSGDMFNINRQLQAEQLKLDHYKERLDAQDKRIGDIGTYISLIGLSIGMLGLLITGIIIFFSIQVKREAILEAEQEAKEFIRKWLMEDGRKEISSQITEELKLPVQEAIAEIQQAADPILRDLDATNTEYKRIVDEAKRNGISPGILATPQQKQALQHETEKVEEIPADQRNYQDWRMLGLNAFYQGDYIMALEYLNKSENFADSDIRHAQTRNSKGVVLLKLGHKAEALTFFDELINRFSEAKEAALLEYVAKAIYNKGSVLGELDHSVEAITAYDEVISRFGDAKETALLEQVANALVGKGYTLGKLDRSAEAIVAYDEVLARFGDAKETALLEQVANALFNKGVTLGKLDRSAEAIVAYDEFIRRFGESTQPGLIKDVETVKRYKTALLDTPKNAP